MYWILPSSSRIALETVTLLLKYLKQNLSPLPIPFYGHIDCTATKYPPPPKYVTQLTSQI